MTVTILKGDCREVLRTLPAESVNCVVTSPPYWGLRDYGVEGQIGLEETYSDYIDKMVSVFEAVRRVLRKDGTAWLNLGDSYATGAGAVGDCPGGGEQGERWAGRNDSKGRGTPSKADGNGREHVYYGPMTQPNRMPQIGLKPKDLTGIPWRVAFALQADGWYLRQDIIWSKPNPMPESVRDRCTKAHEYLFLLSKSERYHFDQDAIMEPVTLSTIERLSQPTLEQQEGSWRVPGKTNGPMKAKLPRRAKERLDAARPPDARPHTGLSEFEAENAREYLTRNKRSVWEVTTQPFSEAHFATFPPALIEPCILAGCPKGGTVLDPFGGAGTTGLVADRLGRNAILIELNPEYAAMAERRIKNDAGMFADVQ